MSNILKEMGAPDHFIRLLRKLYASQEAMVKTRYGTTNWFNLGKEYIKAVFLSSCLFNWYTEYIMWNTKLDESQAGIKIVRRNINNLRHADDTTLMVEWRGTKESLDEGEWGEWKSWLKTQHSKN